MKKVIKIAVTGPESTGKSMLAERLAAHYGKPWVPEYARDYLGRLGRPYEEKDLLAIARRQLEEEEKGAIRADGLLFCDTELIVIKIWSEVKYGRCHPWIEDQIEKHRYDLFLLCNLDIPWENDPLREHPHRREFLFDLYLRELTGKRFPFEVVSGLGEERFRNALRLIGKYFEL